MILSVPIWPESFCKWVIPVPGDMPSKKEGRKYDKTKGYIQLQRGIGEEQKAESAAIFYKRRKSAETDPIYAKIKADWKKRYG